MCKPKFGQKYFHFSGRISSFLVDSLAEFSLDRNQDERLLERMVPADMIREILDADDMEKAFFAQWVLREAYIKWTGEGLSRDLRTISMDKGNYIMLELEPGYSGAIWSRDSLELRFEYEDIILR